MEKKTLLTIFKYSKTCHLCSLFLMVTCLVRPLYEVLSFIKFLTISCFLYLSFARSPAFYGQFLLKILVDVQSRFYCAVSSSIVASTLSLSRPLFFKNHDKLEIEIFIVSSSIDFFGNAKTQIRQTN